MITYLPKILLVDDEIDFLSANSSLLRNSGFDVYSATSADEIFHLVNTFKPALILLDVRLGKHDGREICRKLKDNPHHNAVKIILHSGHPDIAKDYEEFGAEEFIQKPCTIDYLISRINYHLK